MAILETIDISDNLILNNGFDSAKLELGAGMYKVKINYANLHQSNSTASKAINFNIKIVQDSRGNKVNVDKDFKIWFINKENNTINYGLHLIGSALAILGLPKKIESSMFREESVEVSVFNQSTKKYDKTSMELAVIPALAGKELYATISREHTFYNDKKIEKFSIFKFYDSAFRSYKEIKEGLNANEWRSDVDYVLTQERESKQNQDSLAGIAGSYQSPIDTQAQSYNGLSQDYSAMQAPQPQAQTKPQPQPQEQSLIPQDDDDYGDQIPF